jgi:aryl-alcohol dehydrogenase-like predicted oxidoreductase
MRNINLAQGIDVSAIALGTMFFGSTVDESTSFAILDRYLEREGNFLDTANCYQFWEKDGRGDESETLLGRWFRGRGTRDSVVLATKVGARPDGDPKDFPNNAEGLSEKVIRTQIDESLRRLGTDHVDLYYAHIEDRRTPLEEQVGAFAKVVADGKVRLLGVSNHPAWRIERARQICQANGWPAYTVIQQRHSYLRPKPDADLGAQLPVTPELQDYVRSTPDLRLLAYSPLLGGAYSGRADKPLTEAYQTADTKRRLEVLHEVAKETGATANQVVLAWMLHSDPVVIPLVGASSVAQLDEALDAADLTLTQDQMRRLNEAGE